MFKHEGAARSLRKNQVLAGYLAFVAGFVNSFGFLSFGVFTSHVTGNVTRFAERLSVRDGTAFDAFAMIACFFVGAFAANVALESDIATRRPRVYAALLFCEAGLLAIAMVTTHAAEPVARDVLCVAMGLQNSLVTRLSGAVVRTTHLTGVVTDLGIEAARWFRFWRSRIAARAHVRLVAGRAPRTSPVRDRSVLLLTIFAAFLLGSIGGIIAGLDLGAAALALPIALLAVAVIVAFFTRIERSDELAVADR
jgi:uncharacterized membrane protein YoaK (UPF0700 family)